MKPLHFTSIYAYFSHLNEKCIYDHANRYIRPKKMEFIQGSCFPTFILLKEKSCSIQPVPM